MTLFLVQNHCHDGSMNNAPYICHYHEAFEVYEWFLIDDAFVVPVHQLGQLGNVVPCRSILHNVSMLYIAVKFISRGPANKLNRIAKIKGEMKIKVYVCYLRNSPRQCRNRGTFYSGNLSNHFTRKVYESCAACKRFAERQSHGTNC